MTSVCSEMGHSNSQRKMLKEFNDYLTGQIGQPYVWGGQHTKLTPENYVRIIDSVSTPHIVADKEAKCSK